MPDLTINGFKAHYLSAGKGESVVLLHGFTASHAMWWQQIPALARGGFRVVAPDLRGHGDSDHPGRGYDPDTLADDLRALLDALDLKLVHVVGLSLGGMVAQRFALRFPDRVSTLTVADSFSGSPPPEVMEIFREHESIGRAQGMRALFEQLLVRPALPFGPDYQVPLNLFPALERAFLKNRMETMSAHVAMLGALPDWAGELRGIGCPTLLLVGDADAPCLDPMARMKEEIPGSELKVIGRCGHSSAVEKADDFNRLLQEFLRG